MWFIRRSKHERLMDEIRWDLSLAQAARDAAFRELEEIKRGIRTWQGVQMTVPTEDVLVATSEIASAIVSTTGSDV
jgi:environmental stress-induced protein Ves